MRFFWLALAPSIFIQCTSGPKRIPVIINGKPMAYFEDKGGFFGVTVFDLQGNTIYASDFKGGCKGIPQAGYELIGTRFKYDKSGNFISKWDVTPDTSRSVYTESFQRGNTAGTARFIYKYAELDSIVHSDSLDRITHVDDYGGQVCLNFSDAYIGMLNGYFMLYGQGRPYLYDTAVHEDFFPETGGLSFRNANRPDSSIQTYYYKNGKVKSRSGCKLEQGRGCLHAFTNEWFESGAPSVVRMQAGKRTVHRHFFENGKPMTESFYTGTKLDSTYRSWFEDGTLNQRIEYRLGVELKNEEWDQSGKQIQ